MNFVRSAFFMLICTGLMSCGGADDNRKNDPAPPKSPTRAPVEIIQTPAPTSTPSSEESLSLINEFGAGESFEVRSTEHYEINTLIGQVAPSSELISKNTSYGLDTFSIEVTR